MQGINLNQITRHLNGSPVSFDEPEELLCQIAGGLPGKLKSSVRFRQWATRVLNEYLSRGYTLNRHRFEQNAVEL